ncbi:MAG: hypothetical protein ACOX3W_06720 [Christensenellaceae bacterium]
MSAKRRTRILLLLCALVLLLAGCKVKPTEDISWGSFRPHEQTEKVYLLDLIKDTRSEFLAVKIEETLENTFALQAVGKIEALPAEGKHIVLLLSNTPETEVAQVKTQCSAETEIILIGSRYADVSSIACTDQAIGESAAQFLHGDFLARGQKQADIIGVGTRKSDCMTAFLESMGKRQEYTVTKEIYTEVEAEVFSLLETYSAAEKPLGILVSDPSMAEQIVEKVQSLGGEDYINILCIGGNDVLEKALRMGAVSGIVVENLPALYEGLEEILLAAADTLPIQTECPPLILSRQNIDAPALREIEKIVLVPKAQEEDA